MEYGGSDLRKLLEMAPKLKGWGEHHVRFISWQILAALSYLHSANIAHRVGMPAFAQSYTNLLEFLTVAIPNPFPSVKKTTMAITSIKTRIYHSCNSLRT